MEERADLAEFKEKIRAGRATFFHYREALPENGVANNNLGSVYFDSQMLLDALALFQSAVPLDLPFKSGAKANVAAVRKMICAWDTYDEDAGMVTPPPFPVLTGQVLSLPSY